MASLQKKAESYSCQFCYQGRRHTVTVGAVSRDEAEAFRGKADYLLLRIRQGFVRVPPGVAITDFILRDGQVPEPEKLTAEPTTFCQFKERVPRHAPHRGDGSQ